MEKFDTLVDFLLEVDSGVPPAAGTQGTSGGGAQFPGGGTIKDLVTVLQVVLKNNPTAYKEFTKIMGDKGLSEFMDKPLETEEDFIQFAEILGIARGVVEKFKTGQPPPNSAGDLSDDKSKDTEETKPSFWRGKAPSYSQFGKTEFSPYQSAIENALWNSYYWLRNGTFLRKAAEAKKMVSAIGSAIGKVVAPTQKMSTGIYGG